MDDRVDEQCSQGRAGKYCLGHAKLNSSFLLRFYKRSCRREVINHFSLTKLCT